MPVTELNSNSAAPLAPLAAQTSQREMGRRAPNLGSEQHGTSERASLSGLLECYKQAQVLVRVVPVLRRAFLQASETN